MQDTSILAQIQQHALELGFSHIAIAPVDLTQAESGLLTWLDAGMHGSMDYMQRHGLKRARPAELIAGTLCVLTARMDYLPRDTPDDWQAKELQKSQNPGEAVVSLYARGRDYHKVLRQCLQKLAVRIETLLAKTTAPALQYRVFTDSAPVLEVELASRAGLAWRGKHTLALTREAGSMFFLGEIFLNVDFTVGSMQTAHCGSCSACIDVCPTQAIIAPYRVDARRCISYLTIEHQGSIDEDLRPLIGNRVYGCDDCQLVCPWNKYAQKSTLADFDQGAVFSGQSLISYLAWSEAEFLRLTEGSAIRRIGHVQWLRNVAVALGNALNSSATNQDAKQAMRLALQARLGHASEIVREHVSWALQQSDCE